MAFVANGGQFTVEPTIQQKLENAVLESSDFLKRINVVMVQEMKGSALRLGVLSPVASVLTPTPKHVKLQTFTACKKIPILANKPTLTRI